MDQKIFGDFKIMILCKCKNTNYDNKWTNNLYHSRFFVL